MKTNKKVLLASAAIAVMGMTSQSAMAFDTVNWEWNKLITETVIKDVNVNIDSNPTGMTEIEKMQILIGDVTATSSVTDINNNPPAEELSGGVLQVEDFFHITSATDDATDPSTIDPAPGVFGNDLILQAELLGGTYDEGTDVLEMDFRVFGEFEFELIAGELDAADLPKVESLATAVGNNQDIASSTSVQLHDGQFLFGSFEGGTEGSADLDTLLSMAPDLDNTHTEVAAGLALAGALGLIAPAIVSADSTVSGILNASVESAATAVANNMSVTLEATTASDALMIADITQFAYADVLATSSVSDVAVNNYTGFGAAGFGPSLDPEFAQVPLISSVATAVGNNFSVTVTSPALGLE